MNPANEVFPKGMFRGRSKFAGRFRGWSAITMEKIVENTRTRNKSDAECDARENLGLVRHNTLDFPNKKNLREREKERETERETERQRDRERQRETERDRERQRERQRERERAVLPMVRTQSS